MRESDLERAGRSDPKCVDRHSPSRRRHGSKEEEALVFHDGNAGATRRRCGTSPGRAASVGSNLSRSWPAGSQPTALALRAASGLTPVRRSTQHVDVSRQGSQAGLDTLQDALQVVTGSLVGRRPNDKLQQFRVKILSFNHSADGGGQRPKLGFDVSVGRHEKLLARLYGR